MQPQELPGTSMHGKWNKEWRKWHKTIHVESDSLQSETLYQDSEDWLSLAPSLLDFVLKSYWHSYLILHQKQTSFILTKLHANIGIKSITALSPLELIYLQLFKYK